jgi:hypothetical protein
LSLCSLGGSWRRCREGLQAVRPVTKSC